MKSVKVTLEYDEQLLQEGREVQSKLEEQLYGTGFTILAVEKEKTDIIPDSDHSGAGGQSSPDEEDQHPKP
ncbi:hypothetical protein ACFFJY_14945 [Fictibacillus aquaticus]|uniref:Uncharacterized protein n=1 Tax=Fictibacillus aquaticus TaxID=2021314 RepID=A0A235FDN1_9BACL|nr:hypothetical protein [Fictibacillus aquaticus]OYD59510.1 hypothetical protein CGZ90_06360 [Fictibacillus aquaticus]